MTYRLFGYNLCDRRGAFQQRRIVIGATGRRRIEWIVDQRLTCRLLPQLRVVVAGQVADPNAHAVSTSPEMEASLTVTQNLGVERVDVE